MFLDCMLLILALRLTLAAACMYFLAATIYIIFTERENHNDQSKSEFQRGQKQKNDSNEDDHDINHGSNDDVFESCSGRGGEVGHLAAGSESDARLRQRRGERKVRTTTSTTI